jgi:hypothetical protein
MSNVSAGAFDTLSWVTKQPRIAIPVYQREYRWREEVCEQLLSDIRAVAAESEGRSHFIGSILATGEVDGGVTLVDGQQRIVTLMLILAAIADHASTADPQLAAQARSIVLAPGGWATHSRVRPHARYEVVLDDLLSGATSGAGATTFEENYRYLRDRVSDDWEVVWRGIHRLEHVAVSLLPQANAQQIFESLNSTGAALADDELIHNYVHMGRTHDEQVELENTFWVPIEEATAGAHRAFWRDYLVLTADRQPDFTGDFGIYRAFRERYPHRDHLTLDVLTDWRKHAEWYAMLLDPEQDADAEIAKQLRQLATFEGGPRPLVLGVYGDYRDGRIAKDMLIAALADIETMFIRRAVVDLSRGLGVVGTVCRELRANGYPLEGVVRRTPEDAAIRLKLTHGSAPHVGYVLARLQDAPVVADLQIEHIHPQQPDGVWTGGGTAWGQLTVDEQATFRVLLNTLGNLTLLEGHLNAGAGRRSFEDKKPYFRRSEVAETRALAEANGWDAVAIRERTKHLIERFMATWPRPADVPMDAPEELVRVVDVEFPAIGMRDPDRFDYVQFRGELWGDVQDVKMLHWRVAKALWELDSERFRAGLYGGHLHAEKSSGKKYAQQTIGGLHLYNGWATKWLGGAVQEWITEFGLDDEVRVKLTDPADHAPQPT